MNYPPEAFDALMEEVERQGGALLPEPCIPQDIQYGGSPYDGSFLEGITAGCGHMARMLIVCKLDKKYKQPGSEFATVCAVCDNMGSMPRFQDAVDAVAPELNPCFYDREEEDEDDTSA